MNTQRLTPKQWCVKSAGMGGTVAGTLGLIAISGPFASVIAYMTISPLLIGSTLTLAEGLSLDWRSKEEKEAEKRAIARREGLRQQYLFVKNHIVMAFKYRNDPDLSREYKILELPYLTEDQNRDRRAGIVRHSTIQAIVDEISTFPWFNEQYPE